MNARRRLFVNEYMIDRNATRAAIRAGYSVRRSERAGHELVINREVAAEIAKREAGLAKRTERSQDEVAARLASVAFVDMTDVAEWSDGRFVLKDSGALSPAARSAVKKLKVKRRHEVTGSKDAPQVWVVESIELELEDRMKAAELYGKHIGMWPQRPVEINAHLTLEVQQWIMERRRQPIEELLALVESAAPGLLGEGDVIEGEATEAAG